MARVSRVKGKVVFAFVVVVMCVCVFWFVYLCVGPRGQIDYVYESVSLDGCTVLT